jgi:glycosyltransferase involved in cell wall biosynthesis
MKIAFNASILQDNRKYGVSRFAKGMLIALYNKGIDCFIYPESASLGVYLGESELKVPSKSRLTNNYSRLFWNQFSLPNMVKRDKVAYIYSPLAEGMLFPPCNQIITVHDLIPVLYQETNPRLKYYYKFILPTLLKNSRKVAVSSENTKKDLISFFDIKEDKVHVIYPGFDKKIFRCSSLERIKNTKLKYNLNDFILTVGESRQYKNFRNLLLAFAAVPIASLKLVVVGSLSKIDSELAKLPQELGISSKVIFTGYIDDSVLADLYSSADVFIFPSLYEGFGLPLLEAMSCKCPVIASNTSSIPEVCGDAAYYIDPLKVQEIGEAIYSVVSENNIKNKLISSGCKRIKSFSFNQAADQLLSLFQDINLE